MRAKGTARGGEATLPRSARTRAAGVLCAAALLAAVVGLAPVLAGERPPATAWQPAGWGGGGFYWSCAFHPRRDGVIYLGGDVGGAYKTEDKGKHWRFINRGLADYAVYALAVSKSEPDTVFAGTPSGLCKSIDAGEQWRFLTETGKGKLDIAIERRVSVRPIAVDPTNANVVYAGSARGRLYKSDDGGQSWRKLDYLRAFASRPRPTAPAAFRGKGCLVLAYESDAGDWGKNGRAEKHFAAPGADWSRYKKVTARFLVPAGAPRLQAQIVVQSGPKWLWQQGAWLDGKPGQWTGISLDLAGLKDLRTVHILYVVIRSPEAGYHGNVYLDAVEVEGEAGTAGKRDVVVLGDWEKPGDVEGWRANRKFKDALFVTDVRQSDDLAPREKGAISSVAIAEQDPKLLFITSTDYGVLRSEDGGATWACLRTPRGASCAAVAPSDARIVYAALGRDGVRRSDDRGATWKARNAGIKPGCTVREVVVDPTDPDRVCCIGAVGWDGYFYLSADGGRTWTESRTVRRDFDANPTCPEDSGGRAAGTCPLSTPTNLAMNPRRPLELFVAANWRPCFSADGGRTWEERDRGCDITCVTDIRFHAGKVYVTAMDEGLLVSDDRGATWRQLTPMRYDRELSGHLWRVWVGSLGEAARIVATASLWEKPLNQVVLSDDGGKTFRVSRRGLPDYRPTGNTMWGQGYPRALAAHPSNPAVLYLGMDGDPGPGPDRQGGGVFQSVDGGDTWRQLPSQPASRRVFNGLAIDPTEPRRLYWGACGKDGGLHRSEDGGGTWERVFANESWVFNVAVSPTGTVYCPGVNLWRSADHGRTWQKLTAFTGSWVIVGLALDPQDEKRLWISRVTWDTGAAGGVWKTTDGGTTWAEITGDLPYCKPTILRFDPKARELWAGGVGLFKVKQDRRHDEGERKGKGAWHEWRGDKAVGRSACGRQIIAHGVSHGFTVREKVQPRQGRQKATEGLSGRFCTERLTPLTGLSRGRP